MTLSEVLGMFERKGEFNVLKKEHGGTGREFGAGATLRSSLVDLDGVWNIVESEITPIVISATALPDACQWSRTILASEMPSSSDVGDWAAYISIGGLNNTAGAVNLQWRFMVNDVDTTPNDFPIPIAANKYWAFSSRYVSQGVTANDTFGFRLWVDVPDAVDIRYYAIYIVPRKLFPNSVVVTLPAADIGQNASSWLGSGPSGSLSGVTYSPANDGGMHTTRSQLYNPVSQTLVDGAATVATNGIMSFMNVCYLEDTVCESTAYQESSPVLFKPAANNGWIRYYVETIVS